MNAVAQAKDHYLAEFERCAAALAVGNAPWLERMRRAALSRFAERGFPTPRDEDWRYTRVSAIEQRPFTLAAGEGGTLDTGRLRGTLQPGPDGHLLVFIDGRYSPGLSRPGALPAGATLAGLAQALAQRPALAERELGQRVDLGRHPFAALNTAFMHDGAVLALAAGVALEQPIHLLFLSTAGHEGAMAHTRVLIVAEEGSRATVIETHAALDESSYFTNAVTEVALGGGAVLEHYRLQEESGKAMHIAGLHVHQARDSRFTSHAVSLGGALARSDIDVVLDGEGAECVLNGLYLAGGRQHVDYHTRIDHARPRGTSSELYKGVLDGRARGVFNGKVIVRPGAQQTDARQTNRNLLLSADAEADTKPELEIYADDVKCGHGATVGQLDEDAVFFLRSRGIDAAAARDLLTYAFAREMIERVAVPAVRAHLHKAVTARLPRGRRLEELA